MKILVIQYYIECCYNTRADVLMIKEISEDESTLEPVR